MKIQMQKEDLITPLQNIIGAIEKRQTMPALSNVLVKAEKDRLTLTATDLEIELVTTVDLVIDETGSTTIPARKLLDICKSLPDEASIDITVKADKVTIQSGRSRFSLMTLPAADFPALDTIKVISEFEIPQNTLRELINKTGFAMAQQDVRYYLNGLMFEISTDTLRAVATDGHRLAYCEKKIDCEIGDVKQVILPRKGVLELLRLLENNEEKVKIIIATNHLQVVMDNIRFTTKLIDGRFPDYNRVIPDDGLCVMTADRELLRQALVRTSILSNEKYRGIRLILKENMIKLKAQNPDQEEADVETEVNYEGEEIEIGFNVNYMLDVLNVTSSSTVQARFKDSNSSCLLSFPDQDDCKYVIMPMRL